MKTQESDIDDSREMIIQKMIQNPNLVIRELNNRSLHHFIEYFWPVVCNQKFVDNWHIWVLCEALEQIARRVGNREQKLHDLIINIPPGTSKTLICSIMFPVWCWTQWHWMRFITASYSATLSLESAEYSRDLVRSAEFHAIYPELMIRDDKDTKSNFKIIKLVEHPNGKVPRILQGGNRYSTSVGGTLMGFHADIIIWDDPINPTQSISDKERESANHWIDQSLPTRKTDKGISTIIGIMQRLHQDDPTGHILAKKKSNVLNISLPGECIHFEDQVKPATLIKHYVNGLMDVNRMTWTMLQDLEADLGQYGYSGQIGQNPVPPGGGMFHTDCFQIVQSMPQPNEILQVFRYWDKAGSQGKGKYTVGVKMAKLKGGKFIVLDVKRGQWSTNQREKIIRATAVADGHNTIQYIEQEPGSGGMESAEATITNLAGYSCYADRPTGDKINRADPYSVQVNNNNVMLLQADWNKLYIEEHMYFPYGTYKDQVDASSGVFNKLTAKKIASRIL